MFNFSLNNIKSVVIFGRLLINILFIMRFSILLTFFLALMAQHALPQQRISRAEYIATYKDHAIKEMFRSGVPASITLAQGILESGDGNSKLAREANNHFGIKCHSDWRGKTYVQDDDRKDECFRSYKHALESYRDHSEFLKRSRYASLFTLKTTDYKGWAKGLKKAGYATNPKYPDLLIKIIEDNELHEFDRKIKIKEGEKFNEVEIVVKDKESTKKTTTSFTSKGYKILKHENNIKYILTKENESLEELAQQFNMGLWQLYKYNDFDKDVEKVGEGQILFLQPKRSKAKQEYHIVKDGESIWQISQQYGIKIKKLCKRNDLRPTQKLRGGQKLELR